MFFSESLKKSEKKIKKKSRKKRCQMFWNVQIRGIFLYMIVPGRYLKITLKFSDFKGTLSGIALRNTRFWQQKKCKIVFKKNRLRRLHWGSKISIMIGKLVRNTPLARRRRRKKIADFLGESNIKISKTIWETFYKKYFCKNYFWKYFRFFLKKKSKNFFFQFR